MCSQSWVPIQGWAGAGAWWILTPDSLWSITGTSNAKASGGRCQHDHLQMREVPQIALLDGEWIWPQACLTWVWLSHSSPLHHSIFLCGGAWQPRSPLSEDCPRGHQYTGQSGDLGCLQRAPSFQRPGPGAEKWKASVESAERYFLSQSFGTHYHLRTAASTDSLKTGAF
jgi:hypothetical protein